MNRVVCLFLLAGCGVNTGNALTFDTEAIVYTAVASLSATEVDVTVIGQAGAVDRGGGTLTVTNEGTDGSAETGVDGDGSFLFTVGGRLDDTLVLRAVLDEDSGEGSLVLADALAPIIPPGTSTGPYMVRELDDSLSIDLTQISNAVPFLIYDPDSGVTAVVETAGLVTFDAGAGATVCVVSLGDGSTAHCELAP